MQILQERIRMVGHKIDQRGIRPLQGKLEAITKLNTPKNAKEPKCFCWGNTISFEIYKKLISEHR